MCQGMAGIVVPGKQTPLGSPGTTVHPSTRPLTPGFSDRAGLMRKQRRSQSCATHYSDSRTFCQDFLTLSVMVLSMSDVAPLEELNIYNVLANLGRAHRESQALDERIGAIVAAARGFGWSWQKIGDELGISRQAAWERYSATVAPAPRGISSRDCLTLIRRLAPPTSESRMKSTVGEQNIG
jgi:hypothetical protein